MDLYVVNIQKINGDLLQTYPFLQRYLASEEVKSIKKFLGMKDRNIRMVSRITLKYLLSMKIGRPLEEVKIEYNPFGKPHVKNSRIEFNLSHTGNIILFGFSDYNVGVDVEEMRLIDTESAKIFMKEKEYKYFETLLDEKCRMKFFYQIWTAKESLFKATGTGITDQIRQVEIPIVRMYEGIFYENHLYLLIQVEIGTNYMYSLCTRKQDTKAPILKEIFWEEILKK